MEWPNYAKMLKSTVYTSKQTHTKSLDEQEIDRITSVISIRIPASYKLKYYKMNHQQKQIFKLGILALIDAVLQNKKQPIGHTAIFNLNLNVNMNRLESHVEVNTAEVLEEIRKFLSKLVNPPGYLSKPHPWIKAEAAGLASKIERLLGEVN